MGDAGGDLKQHEEVTQSHRESKVRRLWILIMLAAMAFDSFADDACQFSIGVDHRVPAIVKIEIEKHKINGFQLANRTVCGNHVMWHALPPNYPAKNPWPPGAMKLVSWDTKEDKVEIL